MRKSFPFGKSTSQAIFSLLPIADTVLGAVSRRDRKAPGAVAEITGHIIFGGPLRAQRSAREGRSSKLFDADESKTRTLHAAWSPGPFPTRASSRSAPGRHFHLRIPLRTILAPLRAECRSFTKSVSAWRNMDFYQCLSISGSAGTLSFSNLNF